MSEGCSFYCGWDDINRTARNYHNQICFDGKIEFVDREKNLVDALKDVMQAINKNTGDDKKKLFDIQQIIKEVLK
jgi:hypothetical protein